jgi:hypothetical protein
VQDPAATQDVVNNSVLCATRLLAGGRTGSA